MAAVGKRLRIYIKDMEWGENRDSGGGRTGVCGEWLKSDAAAWFALLHDSQTTCSNGC